MTTQVLPMILDIIPAGTTVPPQSNALTQVSWPLIRHIAPCPPDPALTLVAAGLAARALGNLADVQVIGRYHRVLLVAATRGHRFGDPLLPLPIVPQPDRWWNLLREAIRIGSLVSYGWQRPGWEWDRAVHRCVDAAHLTAGEKQVVETVLFLVGAGEKVLQIVVDAILEQTGLRCF